MPLSIYHVFVSDLWTFLAAFYYFIHSTFTTFMTMIVAEASIIRCLIELFWKRPPPFEENFFQFFLIIVSLLQSFLFTGQAFMTHEGGALFYRMSGLNLNLFPEPTTRLYIRTIIAWIAFIGFTINSFLVGKNWYYKRRSKDSYSAQPGEHLRINNSARNAEVLSGTFESVVLAASILMSLPTLFTYLITKDFKTQTNAEMALMDVSAFAMMSVALPMILTCLNPSLRKHLKSLFCCSI